MYRNLPSLAYDHLNHWNKPLHSLLLISEVPFAVDRTNDAVKTLDLNLRIFTGGAHGVVMALEHTTQNTLLCQMSKFSGWGKLTALSLGIQFACKYYHVSLLYGGSKSQSARLPAIAE